MAEPSSAQRPPKTPSGRNQPSTAGPGANGTSRLSCDPAALAPGAQRRSATRNFRPSAKQPRFRPRALTKGRRMLRSGGAQLLLSHYAVGTAAVALPPPPGASECASVSHKLCVECGKMLDASTGYVNSKSRRTGKLYLNSACKPCHNHRTRVVAKLKLKHPRPPAGTPCECCGRVSKLHLDHVHDLSGRNLPGTFPAHASRWLLPCLQTRQLRWWPLVRTPPALRLCIAGTGGVFRASSCLPFAADRL